MCNAGALELPVLGSRVGGHQRGMNTTGLPRGTAVPAGRDAGLLAEQPVELRRAGEAGVVHDVEDLAVGGRQQPAGVREAQMGDVAVDGLPGV